MSSNLLAKGAVTILASRRVEVVDGTPFNLANLQIDDDQADTLYLGFFNPNGAGSFVTFESVASDPAGNGAFPISGDAQFTAYFPVPFARGFLSELQLRVLAGGTQTIEVHVVSIQGDYSFIWPQGAALETAGGGFTPPTASVPLSQGFFIDGGTTVAGALRDGSIARPYGSFAEAFAARGTGGGFLPTLYYVVGSFAAETVTIPAGATLAFNFFAPGDTSALTWVMDTDGAGDPTRVIMGAIFSNVNTVPINGFTTTGDGELIFISDSVAIIGDIDASGAAVGHSQQLQLANGQLAGSLIPPGGIGSEGVAQIISLINWAFIGSVDCLTIERAQNCRFGSAVRILAAPPDPNANSQKSGFFDCEFEGPSFTTYGGGAITVYVDEETARTISDNGVSLGAGLFEVILDQPVLSAGGALLFWGNQSIAASADTRFLSTGWDSSTAPTTAESTWIAPRAGTIRNLTATHNSAAGNGEDVDYEIFVAGVASGVLVTLATGIIVSGSDFVNAVAVAQGATVDLRATKALAIGSGTLNVQCAAEFV